MTRESSWRWADFGDEVALLGSCPEAHAFGAGYYLVRSPGDDHCDGVRFHPDFRGKVVLMCGSGSCPYQVAVYVDVPRREVGRVVPLLPSGMWWSLYLLSVARCV